MGLLNDIADKLRGAVEGSPQSSVQKVNKIASVQTIVYRGDGVKHRDFCHDFLIHHENSQFFIGAVMDGCTGSVHSQFSSSLFGKIFNLLLRTKKRADNLRQPYEPSDLAYSLMYDFCAELSRIKYELALANNELHCTILLSVYSKVMDRLFVIGFGDGYIYVNGQGYKIENTRYGDTEEDGVLKEGKNKPDYLIDDIDRIFSRYTEFNSHPIWYEQETDSDRQEYHQMSLETRQAFNEWYSNKQPTFQFDGIHDFSIATDGILSFRRANIDLTDRVIELLLDRKEGYGGTIPVALRRKMNIISHKEESDNPDKMHGINDDDVSIIRVMVEKSEVEFP